MILDSFLEFCSAESVAGTAGTALIGDVVDLGGTSQDIGTGEPLFLVIQTTTEVITAGAAGTIQFKLSSDAAAAIATDGSATDHIVSASLVTDDAGNNSAALNAGGQIFVGRLPAGNYERYLGILAIIATTTVTAGAIDAFLTHDVSKWTALPDAVN